MKFIVFRRINSNNVIIHNIVLEKFPSETQLKYLNQRGSRINITK
mgnify:CR=1 FL=1